MRSMALCAVICVIGGCGYELPESPGVTFERPGVDPAAISPTSPVSGGEGGCAGDVCGGDVGETPAPVLRCLGCDEVDGGLAQPPTDPPADPPTDPADPPTDPPTDPVEPPTDPPVDRPTDPQPECLHDADCPGGICVNQTCKADPCKNGVKGGDETGVDCGGHCAPCPVGKGCSGPSDCQTGHCAWGVCCTPNECGSCYEPCCVPKCSGRECGDDGCGGSCGTCDAVDDCDTQSGECLLAWGCEDGSPACTLGPPDFGPAFRVTRLRIAATGKPGHGFDLDPWKGPADCSPKGMCAAGVDNILAPLGAMVNKAMVQEMKSGATLWLGELDSGPGRPLGVRFHLGEGPSSCQDGVCTYASAPTSWQCDCSPWSRLTEARVEGVTLQAGGPGDVLIVPLTLAPGVSILVPLYSPRMTATVTFKGGVKVVHGLLGGAIHKVDLNTALKGMGDPALASQVFSVINPIFADVDTDGDLFSDGVSIGLHIEGEPARLDSVAAP